MHFLLQLLLYFPAQPLFPNGYDGMDLFDFRVWILLYRELVFHTETLRPLGFVDEPSGSMTQLLGTFVPIKLELFEKLATINPLGPRDSCSHKTRGFYETICYKPPGPRDFCSHKTIGFYETICYKPPGPRDFCSHKTVGFYETIY